MLRDGFHRLSSRSVTGLETAIVGLKLYNCVVVFLLIYSGDQCE
jgi:hypothetical protein